MPLLLWLVGQSKIVASFSIKGSVVKSYFNREGDETPGALSASQNESPEDIVEELGMETGKGIVSETDTTKPGEEYLPFKAGGIHDVAYRQFWRHTLKASQWVMDLLEVGYVIPFSTIPGEYQEKNNKSARESPEVVRELLQEMIQKDIVRVVSRKPHCVSPLGLVSKQLEDGSMKYRLIWDGSRHVNKHLTVPHVRLAHLEKALELTMQGDLQVTYDLTSAYYHIRIHPEQTQFLGAALEIDNTTIWVEYQVLPFGLASAVHAITKVFKPIQGFLNGLGIRSSVFIDDGRILATSEAEAETFRQEVYKTLAAAGWALAPDKSDRANEASQVKKYLGFIIDSNTMKVQALPGKLGKLDTLLKDILPRQAIPVRLLASLLGKIIALEPSHAMLARVATRSGYELLAKHTEEHGWKGCILPSPELKAELEFFQKFMFSMNGACIRTSLTCVRLETILPKPVAITYDIPGHMPASQIIVSDSSHFKAFVYGMGMPRNFELAWTFTTEQRNLSSTGRELLALLFALRHWHETNQLLPTSIYWATDSSSAAACVAKGSKSPKVQEIVFEIAQLCMRTGTQVTPLHLRREDPRIQLADEGSKVLDTDNWSIDYYSFQDLHAQFHFEFDLFASHDNAKVSRYCSLYHGPFAQAIEAWSLDWSALPMLWICPPVSQLVRVQHRIRQSPCEGVVCLPLWKTATYFPFFFDNNGAAKSPFRVVKMWHPYIVQNEGATNTPLFGITAFQFVALHFCTKN